MIKRWISLVNSKEIFFYLVFVRTIDNGMILKNFLFIFFFGINNNNYYPKQYVYSHTHSNFKVKIFTQK